MASRNVDTLGGVIEGPLELHFRWICIHLAGYIRLLLFRHTVDFRLVRLARRGDCGHESRTVSINNWGARTRRIFSSCATREFFILLLNVLRMIYRYLAIYFKFLVKI